MPSLSGRRRFLRDALALAAAAPALARPSAAPARAASDFDALWRAIDERYAYLERGHEWRSVSSRWRPRAAAARSRDDLVAALEGAIAELNDEHVTLDAHGPASPRPVPTATDLWGEWVGAHAIVSAVRAGSAADSAGAVPGMRVVTIQGKPAEAAVRGLLRKSRQSDPRARDWALRRLLAGPWSGMLAIEGQVAGRARRLEIERRDVPPAGTPPLVARRIGEERNLGYLRIKNNLADPGLVQHFDAVLQQFRGTRALILDLRETQAGGSAEVAKALLGRFVTAERPWAVRAARPGSRADAPPELVSPRGPFAYTARTVVLVDRWTAGEGESLAMGLDAAANATLVGTAMAGLRGDLREARLPDSGIVLRYPGARVFHPNGTPREALRPAVPVDIVAPSGGPGDPILYQALKLLESGATPSR